MSNRINCFNFLFISVLLSAVVAKVFSQEFSEEAKVRVLQYRSENQYSADLGNGYYKNPVLPVSYGDVTVAQYRDNYYMAFTPGHSVITFRSKDLVNWEPVGHHVFDDSLGNIWAPDLAVFNGQLHIYMPVNPENAGFNEYTIMVSSTSDPKNGWSEPVDLKTLQPWAIDPGVIVTPNGEKFLYVEDGLAAPLAKDGKSLLSPFVKVYDGWPIPEDWVVECFCLEGIKLVMKDDYYYLLSTQGGTSGPSTGHMGAIARSKNPMGPWENSPYNPLMRTMSSDEPWWQQGHGDIIQGPGGDWWIIYTAKINGYPELGKQSILMPLEWTEDGWPVLKGMPEDVIKKPAQGVNVGHGLPFSDNFNSDILGIQWIFNGKTTKNITCGDGKLTLEARGKTPKEGSRLELNVSNRSYEASVEVECSGSAFGGIGLISGASECVATDGQKAFIVSDFKWEMWRLRNSAISVEQRQKVFLKIRNWRKDISYFYSADGENWHKFNVGARVNESYRVNLFASGEGEVTFRNFIYTGLE